MSGDEPPKKSRELRDESLAVGNLVTFLRSKEAMSETSRRLFVQTYVPTLQRASERLIDASIKLEKQGQ